MRKESVMCDAADDESSACKEAAAYEVRTPDGHAYTLDLCDAHAAPLMALVERWGRIPPANRARNTMKDLTRPFFPDR